MFTRPGFAGLEAVYARLREVEGPTDDVRTLPQRVISELICLASLSVYIESDLEMEWLAKAFMTDASEHGYGV
eukprot:8163982-Pyramimonas_sp.AAC.1